MQMNLIILRKDLILEQISIQINVWFLKNKIWIRKLKEGVKGRNMIISKNRMQDIAFTSPNIISKKLPILFMTINEDNTWEFWGNEYIGEETIIIVSLKEILEIDPVLNDFNEIQCGLSYFRISQNAEWQVYSE